MFLVFDGSKAQRAARTQRGFARRQPLGPRQMMGPGGAPRVRTPFVSPNRLGGRGGLNAAQQAGFRRALGNI